MNNEFNNNLENILYKKIESSLKNKKLLHGITEIKIIKYYNLNKENKNFQYKKYFEDYIIITHLRKRINQRKKILIYSLLLLIYNLCVLIYINSSISILLLIGSIISLIFLLYQLKIFNKYKKNAFN